VKLRIGVNLVKLDEDVVGVDFALSVYARGSHQQKRGSPHPVGSVITVISGLGLDKVSLTE
jgi:hypothetical protein